MPQAVGRCLILIGTRGASQSATRPLSRRDEIFCFDHELLLVFLKGRSAARVSPGRWLHFVQRNSRKRIMSSVTLIQKSRSSTPHDRQPAREPPFSNCARVTLDNLWVDA